MAQRRCLGSLAATADLPCLAARFAQSKEARPVPGRPGDGAGDARKASMGFAVPQEAVIRDGDLVNYPSPLAHQDCSRPRQRACGKLGRLVVITERTGQEAVEF